MPVPEAWVYAFCITLRQGSQVVPRFFCNRQYKEAVLAAGALLRM
jgi:hypothetical protein